MKIDERIISYDLHKHPAKTTSEAPGQVDGLKTPDDKRTDMADRSDQDVIVHISKASKEAQIIREAIASVPDVREDKVAELKAKITSGKYEIDFNAVADKLVNSILDEMG